MKKFQEFQEFQEFQKKVGTGKKAAELIGISESSFCRKKNGDQITTKQDLMLMLLPVKTLEKISSKVKKI